MLTLSPSQSILQDTFDPEFAAREALLYLHSGYPPVVLSPGLKYPADKDWQTRSYVPATLALNFPFGSNLGVRTGTPHPIDAGWQHVMIDIDCSINDDQTSLRVLQCLPRDVYPTRTGLASRISFHCMSDVVFKNAGKIAIKTDDAHSFAYDGLTKAGKPKYAQIEIRGVGHQSMVGNSLHPGDPRIPGQFVTRWLGPPLHSYHVASLPKLSKFRLQEIVAIFSEPKSPIHRLSDAAPGSIHDSIVGATAWMANNQWPESDVQERMEILWDQLCEDWDDQSLDRNEKSFTTEWQTAIRTARAKFQGDEKPSFSARSLDPDTVRVAPVKPKSSNANEDANPKLRLPRLMADSWRTTNTLDGVAPRVDDMGQIRIYRHGWWRAKPSTEIRYELMREFNTLEAKDAKSAVETMLDTLERMPKTDQELICTRNGALDIKTLTLHPHSPDFGLTTAVPFNFDSDPSTPVYDLFMTEAFKQVKWGDDDERDEQQLEADGAIMRELWEEFAGYCLTNSTAMQSMLVLVGPTGSGKSTVAKTLSWMLPEEDVSAVPLSKMEDPRYHAGILSKRINISYETGTSYSEATDFINSTAAGDPQTVRRMREEPVNTISPVKLIFVGNRILRTSDTSGAIQRRMILALAPNRRENADQRDISFPDRLRTEAGGIFSRYALAGNRLLKRGKFVNSNYSVLALQANKNAESVAAWYSTRCEYDIDGRMPNEMLYYDYRVWAIDNGFKPVNVIEWGTRLSNVSEDLIAKQVRMPGTKIRQRVRPIRFLEGVKPNLGPEAGSF